MKSLFRIYIRYIFSAAWIAAAVIVVNLTVYGVSSILFYRSQDDLESIGSRAQIEQISALLVSDGTGGIVMEETGYELLRDSGCEFAFLLNGEGDRIWEWQAPEVIKLHYTVGEVAAFTRWYLEDYPVRVWNCEEGLFVMAGTRGSITKFHFTYSVSTIRSLPFLILILVGANLGLVVFFAILSGYRFYTALRPVAYGLEGLAEQRRVTLPERGTARDLAVRLNQVSQILEEQRRNLEKRDTARTEWISGVSHDIRTPLSMVMGYADHLENDRELSDQARKEAGIIKEQSLKIKTLIEDLNLTSKLEYRMQPLRVEEYKPAALIRSVVVSYLNGGLEEGYELEAQIGEALEGVALFGDVRLITRALQNLIGNSIRHNPPCRIMVTGEMEEKAGIRLCRISVRDEGKGIPSSIRDVLMDQESWWEEQRTERGDLSQAKRPHIMGLRIVKQIALAHAGGMGFSEDGREVILYLPIEEKTVLPPQNGKKSFWRTLWYGERR